jgi:hypothetical protein
MESLQQQISRLGEKVDALHQIIANLDRKLTQGLRDTNNSVDHTQTNDNYLENHIVENFNFKAQLNFSSQSEHKDILLDGVYPDINSQQGEKQIAAEIQITRLTAQLTAAYNRIAALEEQLMRQRTH